MLAYRAARSHHRLGSLLLPSIRTTRMPPSKRLLSTSKPSRNSQENEKTSQPSFDIKYIAGELLVAAIILSASTLAVALTLRTLPDHDPYAFYLPLNSEKSFRILILEQGRPEDQIKCILKRVSSFSDGEYEALSYAWGDQTGKSEWIWSNGIGLAIQPNLASALRAIRLPNRSRAIWVDAICINQKNLSEKAFQVPLMRDIYANARQVIIWLGDKEDSDSRAFGFIKWLSDYFDEQGNRSYRTTSRPGFDYTWDQIKSEQQYNFKFLVALLRRDWFIRTWVVQELASAQSAVLVWGDSFIPWDLVSDVFTKLQHPSLIVSDMEGIQTQAALNSLLAMETARRSVNGTYSLSLFQILLATCFNQCTDPRDKIFAVLGMAKDWQKKGGLAPDYSARTTAEEVFRRFAAWDIQTNGKIRILSCVNGINTTSSLPSWAPDWRKINNDRPFVRYSEQTKFSASGARPVDAWYSDYGQVLHTIGEVVDSVDEIGSEPTFCRTPLPPTEHDLDRVEDLANWLIECRRLAADTSNGQLSRKRYDEFWRTLMCGLTGDASPVTPEYQNYFYKYWNFVMSHADPTKFDAKKFMMQGSSFDIIYNAASKLVKKTPPSNTSDFTTNTLVESSLENWASRRRFSTTSEGRLAFMPPESRRGDLICILYGGEVPYLLRPQGPESPNKYVVVGECYVEGIMHGEGLSRDISRLRHFKLV